MTEPRTRRQSRAKWASGLAFAGIVAVLAFAWSHREGILTWYRLQRLGFVPAARGEWPMWGGSPSRNLVNSWEKGIPQAWDIETGHNVKWVARLGSQSYSNPVVAEGRIFVGTNNQRPRDSRITADKGVLMCFREEDGEFLWQAIHDKLAAGRKNDWPGQGVASTPAVENGRLYYVSNRCELVCADVAGFHDGENDGPYQEERYTQLLDADFIWIYDMIAQLDVFPHNLAASSPLVVGDLVYVITSNGVERDHVTVPKPRAPSFIAVDKKTGRLKWQRADPGKNILHAQWSSPAFGVAGGRPQVVFPGGDGWIYSFEPLTGDLLWKFDCNPKGSVWQLGRGTRNNFVAPPAFVDGRVYIAVGQDPEHGEGPGHFYSVDASGIGDVTGTHQVWHYGGKEFRRSLSTAAVHGDLVFITDLSGFLHCVDRETGRPHWVHDLSAEVWSSPMVVDGKVFIGDEDGDVEVLEAGKKKNVLAETNMNNSVYTISVAAKGVLYINTRSHLYAIARSRP